jgi:hypothetical protein
MDVNVNSQIETRSGMRSVDGVCDRVCDSDEKPVVRRSRKSDKIRDGDRDGSVRCMCVLRIVSN